MHGELCCTVTVMTQKLSLKELAAYARLSLDELDKYCTHTASRSSGPGGQSVNTTDSRVQSRFAPDPSIRASSQRERSQYLNRRANLKKIHDKLVVLSTPEKKRVDTKPSKAAQEKRLTEKKKKSAIKKSRAAGLDED